jgi:hypothetical protein
LETRKNCSRGSVRKASLLAPTGGSLRVSKGALEASLRQDRLVDYVLGVRTICARVTKACQATAF